MLTSKELIERAGISRATLNNYIALGILARPLVKKPEAADEKARQLGYFPDDTLGVIETVQSLKRDGLSMAAIAARLGGASAPPPAAPTATPMAPPARDAARPVPAPETPATPETPAPAKATPTPTATGVRLTLDRLETPAYMVNYNFLIEWCNDQASEGFFGLTAGLDPEIDNRSFFKLLANSAVARNWQDRDELIRFHLSIAKIRLPKEAFAKLAPEISNADLGLLQSLYDGTRAAQPGMIAETRVNMADARETPKWHNVYATFFREGVLFIHSPAEAPADTFLELLSRRDQLIRDLFRSRKPVFTPLCVMVADLQDSVKICAELPPDEYFELINQIWHMAENVLRRYHATQGKHAGDGMVSYFFPQPDRNYLLNAFVSAKELQQKMRELSHEWQLRKNWTNELYLNIGLNEGEEWFGTYHSATNLEFTVLGDTINHAGRLSDFARYGAVWATKNLVGKLNSDERERLQFGIRRTNSEGRDIWVPASYSRLSNLLDLNQGQYEKFRDIATLAITEIIDFEFDDDTSDAQTVA